MAFQFAHVETYSRKGSSKGGQSVSWVLAEARRDDGACPHVVQPGEPAVVHGVDLNELEKMHDDLCASVRNEIAGGKTRAVRIDQHTLFTVVVSYPVATEELKNNPEEQRRYEEWEQRNIAWLNSEYGSDIKTIIRHDDEQYPHLHAYALPDDLRCLNLHAGQAAKNAIMKAEPEPDEDSKAHNKRGDKAYRAAMSAWQDRYFEQVGLPSGLTRLGPGKRRLSREEWRAEKSAAQSVQVAQERARQIEAQKDAFVSKTKEQASNYIEKAKARAQAEADKLKADALAKAEESKRLHSAAVEKERAAVALVKQAEDRAAKTNLLNERAKKMASEASKTLSRARSEAKSILSAANQKARSVAGFGGFMRSLVDGLRKSKIRDQIEQEKAGEISAINYAKNLLQGALDREKDLRRETDNRLRNVSATLRDTSERLVSAHAQISELTPKPKAKSRSSTSNYNRDDDRDYSVSRGMKM
uniref:Mob protein n=1 Tax=Brucella anthropi TaxID=529 RepID=Q003I7_BRUAN|nr:mob protein [Brucella anthropi]ABI98039.1 mob protein [Brucella anthropi]